MSQPARQAYHKYNYLSQQWPMYRTKSQESNPLKPETNESLRYRFDLFTKVPFKWTFALWQF